jgi:xanthine/uracil permease
MPFLIGSLIIMLIGVIWPLGQFFTMMPSSVAYAVAFVPYSQMIGIGLSNFTSIELNQRNLLIIGLTLLTGVGLMFVPPTAYVNMPLILQTVISNGLLMGIILVLILEHVVFRNL